ncbi:hypothetical protein SAMN05428979_1186 [Stappia sp. ES.058]|nr:hypothetical protein SAMN05428979_1186 [Stappia sp. ES.058]
MARPAASGRAGLFWNKNSKIYPELFPSADLMREAWKTLGECGVAIMP